ncbi:MULTISPECIES: hypothetical protein [unclassified Pantoea]|jgi:hypothetical protein|uniref:hypothetical protein n=1 Tax=unclassified Pantoea TaxID=2630326 RepID=UPI0023D9B4F2|nr:MULTISPECIES: hypothetical protein [unclassified Pantoea]MDF2040843.1 hypothetical protein [Pantoea sp. Cr_R14]MDF2071250.1 hypothetical protein [Pantoea sp. Cr_R13]MDF2080379.1 hypothetical protein [Pantoea sp. Cr_R21]
MSYGYQPVKPVARYRVVMDGKGKLIVQERQPLWRRLFCGLYCPVSQPLKDLVTCDEFVARKKLEEAGKTNAGLVVKEYR